MSSESPETYLEPSFPVEKSISPGQPSGLDSALKPHDDEQGIRSLPSKRHVNRGSSYNAEVIRLMDLKAILQFISSYPVELVEKSEKPKLQESISIIEEWFKELSVDGNPTSSTCTLPIRFYGDYVPQEWTDLLMSTDKFRLIFSHFCNRVPVKQIPSWAIKSAIRQASESILEANTRIVAISGQGAKEVAEALIDMPEIQSKFDIVFYVSGSQHVSIEEVDECIEEQIDKLTEANSSLLSLEEEKTCRFVLILYCNDLCFINQQTLITLMNRDYACLLLATQSGIIYHPTRVDVSIRMKDHLLPLELFCQHVRHSYNDLSSAHRELDLALVDQCDGDLVAVVLLAKELNRHSTKAWEVVVDELKSNHSSHVEEGVSKPMIYVLTFIWKHKDAITKLCIRWFATRNNGEELTTSSLVSSWLADGLVQTEGEGLEMINDLTKSGLLENYYSDRIIMKKEIKDVLLKYIIPSSLGSPLTDKAIVDDAEIINLGNSGITDLPDSPNCATLVILCLQSNLDIMTIPPSFFKHMPMLSTLNLSYTSIKTLPSSISALVSLTRLFLRGCELFLELPPEIGQLSDLEVIDLEGTRVTHLPNEIAKLQKLRILKVSFFAFGENLRRRERRIPKALLSKLNSLEELRIDVDPDAAGVDEDEWIADIQESSLGPPQISSIALHVPDTWMLENLHFQRRDNYKFIVGCCGERMISRIPSQVEEKFKQQRKYLKYVNGESVPLRIKYLVKQSNAFILDRHWTAKSLSEFATDRILDLRLCMLVECNELQTILDDDDDGRFQCMEYLHIYYMKNLRRICSGHSLCGLKYLSLCTCTSLTSIFTISFLSNLPELEELVVEDCPKIESLVAPCSAGEYGAQYLPKLKTISLRELPDLVRLSDGLKMGPNLEKLVIFYCPKLESISEVLGGNLKVIKGETEWWESLSWKETDGLASIFVPLQRDGDLMAQFTEY